MKSQSVFDEIDNRTPCLPFYQLELSSIYKLINERKISNAFQEIRSILFQLDNIPEAVEKLRLHFSSTHRVGSDSVLDIDYHPNIYVGVHELVFSAFKFKVPRDVFLSLLGWYKFIVTSSSSDRPLSSRSVKGTVRCVRLAYYRYLKGLFDRHPDREHRYYHFIQSSPQRRLLSSTKPLTSRYRERC